MKRRAALLCGAALLSSGCTALRSASVPMHQIYDRQINDRGLNTLIVFLPGIFDYAQDFEKYGFNREVRTRRLPVDMVAIDANIRYFNDGSIAGRIHEDVIAPARAHGYKRIWLVGISLGGLGTMLYSSRYNDVDGIVAIAPFLGRPSAFAEIEAAGGYQAWTTAASSSMLSWERDLHLWLKNTHFDQPQPGRGSAPRLLLGFGLNDPYALAQQRLAARLPRAQVFTTPGGHQWLPWQRLWRNILDQTGDEIAGLTDGKP